MEGDMTEVREVEVPGVGVRHGSPPRTAAVSADPVVDAMREMHRAR
jgi:hypothetical protein